MAFYGNVKEGEVINNVREDFFSDFDCKKLLGNIDFCVAEKNVDIDDFDVISLMWAEWLFLSPAADGGAGGKKGARLRDVSAEGTAKRLGKETCRGRARGRATDKRFPV